MYTWIFVFLLCSWKIEKNISKMKRSKVTDYAALKKAHSKIIQVNFGEIPSSSIGDVNWSNCWQKGELTLTINELDDVVLNWAKKFDMEDR